MVWYEEFLHFLQGKMERPTWFGWFHILWIALMAAACILIFIFRKKFSKKSVNNFLLIIGIVLIVFEIYKQIIYSFNYNGGQGNSTWDYQWYAFPFQFCSTPMYLFVIAGILRKGKVYDCILSYLATFALFAGLIVMIYPGDVFCSTIGINLQTMLWHSSMFVIGFMLWCTRSVKVNFHTFLKSSIVFVSMLALALVMNIVWHFVGNEETFNMFYISPYYPCSLPVFNIIYQQVPYIIFLFLYIFGFSLASLLVVSFVMLSKKLQQHLHKKSLSQNELATEKILKIIKDKF